MEFIERLKKVVDSGILSEGLSDISKQNATQNMIDKEEECLPRKLSHYHRKFLETWNGSNFDFIRVYGVGKTENEFIKSLCNEHKEWEEIIEEVEKESIFFADDISGFMYFELKDFTIVQLDTDGGGIEKVADDMNDFFLNFVFGKRAYEYAGDDWLQELVDAKII